MVRIAGLRQTLNGGVGILGRQLQSPHSLRGWPFPSAQMEWDSRLSPE